MRAVILAAGRATRLRPLTDAMPKCLLEVAGKSLIARALGILADHGVRRFTIVDGFMGDLLRAALVRELPAEWLTLVRNEDWATTNNAYSLNLARFADEGLFLLDSDVIFAPDVVRLMLEAPMPNRLALRTRGGLGDEEVKVALARDGTIANITKSIPPATAAGESVGLHVFSPEFTADLFSTLERRMIAEKRVDEWYEAAFIELIGRGAAIHAVDVSDLRCMEIDTPEDLHRARATFE